MSVPNRTLGACGDVKCNRTPRYEFRHSPASAPEHAVRACSSAFAVLCQPSFPSLPILNLFCAGFLFSEWAIGLRAGFSLKGETDGILSANSEYNSVSQTFLWASGNIHFSFYLTMPKTEHVRDFFSLEFKIV